jgi:site-specific DNA-methyltransferase (adenine-specific)
MKLFEGVIAMLNKIIHGDCLEVMWDIPTGSVDMILCDLPYGVTGNRDKWDKILPLEDLWGAYKRIIKPNGAIVLTAINPFASLLITSNLEMFKYEWVWEKEQGSNFATVNHQPFRVHELVLVFSEGKITYTPRGGYMTYNPQKTDGKPYEMKRSGMTENLATAQNYERTSGKYDGKRHPRSVQKFNKETGLHPTQKPVALFEYLIKTYTNEGETVLDNCAGSFTTAVACDNTNRNWICIEKEEEYCNIGLTRVNDNRERLSLPLLNSIAKERIANHTIQQRLKFA